MANRIILNETSYFGKGAIQHITEELNKRNYQKIVVVTDKTLIDHGVATKVMDLLDEAGVHYDTYDGIVPNPT